MFGLGREVSNGAISFPLQVLVGATVTEMTWNTSKEKSPMMRLMTLVHVPLIGQSSSLLHAMMGALQLVMQFGRKKKKYRVSVNSARNGSTKVPFAAITCVRLLV